MGFSMIFSSRLSLLESEKFGPAKDATPCERVRIAASRP
jgi:hypothetical protein